MAQAVNGSAPLAYLGVQALTPPQQYISRVRAPTGNDTNYNVGTFWLYINPDSSVMRVQQLWQLVRLSGPASTGVATWMQVYPLPSASGITSIATSGGVPATASMISLTGGPNSIFATSTNNSITLSFTNTLIAPGSLEVTNGLVVDAGGAVVTSGGLTVEADGFSSTGPTKLLSLTNGVLLSDGAGNISSSTPSVTIGYVLTSQGDAVAPQWLPAGALALPISIADGGTNNNGASYTTDGVVYYTGTEFTTTDAGLNTEVLTSQGPGMAPIWAPAGGSAAGANAFLYQQLTDTGKVFGYTPTFTYTYGTSVVLTKIFDNSGTSFAGTTWTCPATGTWELTAQYILRTPSGGGPSNPGTMNIVVNDLVTPANSITYTSPPIAQSSGAGATNSGSFTTVCKMSVGATVTFVLYAVQTSGFSNAFTLGPAASGGFTCYPAISGYQLA